MLLASAQTTALRGSPGWWVKLEYESRAKALRTPSHEVVSPGLRGMFWPFARPRFTSIADWRDLMWRRFAPLASMSNPIGVDSRATSAALGNRAHGDDLGPQQVTRSCPSDMEGQRDETVGAAFRAWPHCPLMVPLPPVASRWAAAPELISLIACSSDTASRFGYVTRGRDAIDPWEGRLLVPCLPEEARATRSICL